MNHRTSILRRRNVRPYIAAIISYLMLAGQAAPLALAASAAPRAASRATASSPAQPSSRAAAKPAPLVFAAPNIVASKVDAFDDSVVPNGKAEPGQVVTYTVTIQNTGDADASNVQFSDTVDTNTSLNSGSVNTQPITDPDTYAASGNIPITLAAPGVMSNDRDPDTGNNSGLTVSKVQGLAGNVGTVTNTTAVGRGGVNGTVNLAANGGFTYEPPPGFEGADTFTYEVTDGTKTDGPTTVTINVGGANGMVWFIQNNAGGSNRGTFSQPFTSIAAFNTANNVGGAAAAPNPKDGDFVALRTGTGSYNEADGVNLRAQQKLIGEGVAFNTSFTTAAPNSSSAYTTFAGTAGTAPNITTTGACAVANNGNGVDLSADNTVRGLNVGNTASCFKFNGGAVGSPTINSVNLTGTGGAINVSTSGAFANNVTFGSFESTSTALLANVNLVSVTGTLGVTTTGTGLTNTVASPVVNISGGTVSFSYPGTVSRTSGTGALISVSGGHQTGTVAFSGTVSASAGTGLQFDNADGTYNFTGTTTLGGGDAGIDILSDSAGTFSFNASTTITSPTGTAFNVSRGAAATCNPTVTYSGTITHNTASQRAVNIDGTTGGSITINSVTAGSTAGGVGNTGVNINNSNGNITFTTLNLGLLANRMTAQALTITNGSSAATYQLGTFTIFTNNAKGLVATGFDGTLNNNAASTIDTSNATALDIDGPGGLTTLGMSLVKVDSAGGTADGISIQDTNGSFTINGDGSNTALGGNSTGGTISNKSGADGVTTAGIGVYLNNVQNIVLRRMTINGTNQNHGIRGFQVNNFTLQYSTVNGTVGTSPNFDNYGEGAIYFGDDASTLTNGMTGTGTVTSCIFGGSRGRNFSLVNTTGTLDRLTVTNSTFQLNQNFQDAGDAFSAEARNAGTVVKVTLTGSTFQGTPADHFEFVNQEGTGACDVVFQNNTITNAHAQNIIGGGGLTFATASTMTFNASGNNMRDSNGSAITLQMAAPLVGSTSSRNFSGTLNNNIIGNAATLDSGSKTANGIFLSFADNKTAPKGTATVAITNNQITRYKGNAGIYADNTGGDYNVNLTITGNTTTNPGTNAFAGLALAAGAPATSDDIDVCANVTNNDFSTGDPTNSNDIIVGVSGSASSMRLPGYVGTTVAQVAAFVDGNNLNAATTATTAYDDNGAAGAAPSYSGGASPCATPSTAPVTIGETPARGTVARGTVSSQETTTARTTTATGNNVTGAPFVSPRPSTTTASRGTATGTATTTNAANRTATASGTSTAPTVSIDGSGGTVSVNIGTLRAGDSVTITFTVTIDNPYSGGNDISNQGTVSGSNFTSVFTNDPDTGAANDATKTPVNGYLIRVNDATQAEPTSGNAQMLFALTLNNPAPSGGLSVSYSTANGTATGGASCDGTADYITATSQPATVPQGSKTALIPVTVCADNVGGESSETLTVNISSPSAGTIQDGSATGTITQGNTPGTFLISEMRATGPAGPTDDFVEFYNNTNASLTVTASDASAGYGVFSMGAGCNDTPVLVATIPNTTVIPARGHYLVTGAAYSLANYGGAGAAAGNSTFAIDLAADANLAVFTTADVNAISSANRLDAVGFGGNTTGVCALLQEGTNIPAVGTQTLEYSFFRKECDFVAGVGCQAAGNPRETNNNSTDFMFADTQGVFTNGHQHLGAPGPERNGPTNPSPIRRDNAGVIAPLLDGTKSSSASPNRERDFTPGDPTTSPQGTLSIRRRVQNTTASTVTRLRFRIIELTTYPNPGGGQADLRAITSLPVVISGITDPGTCAQTGTPTTQPCQVTAQATTLETPPNQPNGGGYNSTLSVNIPGGLAPSAAIDVNFTLGVVQSGTFRFTIIIEALP